jgi:hypothetical protein
MSRETTTKFTKISIKKLAEPTIKPWALQLLELP